ncbi:hypothetical protein CSB45_11950 [candidate division KSB3 bacterium]|uniref:Roadblock/LAMTOR2 domain-containing protein n=1 Tax=candidate division KSB3 bacterium TaxID=2044937 RepID=A0A2G6E2R4_9BACT|nr:MAG: hypothetical protein CSB45_11950 [candidate division KSB3 bacterium]PIE29232.1 MAG: hypothetical protein CSA57_09500 [candidate division KSB3 bacterium]
MPAERYTEVLHNILSKLKTYVDGVEYAVIILSDGTQLAELPPLEMPGIAALLKDFGKIAQQLCQQLEIGSETESLIKGKKRFLAVYGSSKHILLGVVGQSSVNLGLLNSGARKALEKIEAMLSV